MKRIIIITALLFVSSLGFSQSIKDFKVRNKLTVDVEFELNDSTVTGISTGDTLATTEWIHSLTGAGTASNIADGTVDNQFTTWNNTTGEWTPTTGITFDDSLNVTNKVVAGEIKTPTILSNNFYVTLNRDTTDTGTWKYVISGDTLIWSVYDGAAWDVIQKLIND